MTRKTFLNTLASATTGSLLFIASCAPAASPVGVAFPSGIDHSGWDSLLKKHVNRKGLVDYKSWKNRPEDLKTLDRYLAQFGKPTTDRATGDELGAAAINAYNAFAVRTILEAYPVKTIENIDRAFTQKTHRIGGKKVSLDQIEKTTVIPQVGPRGHALVVCCAMSCPPLQPTAYTAENLDGLAKTASEAWLARPDLNNFDAGQGKITISKIFDWYASDFDSVGGVKAYLRKHAPESAKGKIEGSNITYLDYNWALNAQ